MKLRTIVYVNKDDPRLFVYKHRRWKWGGVTLNFAHAKSFGILLVTLASSSLPLLPVLTAPIRLANLFSLILFALWSVALVFYYYRRAAGDLSRHPGDPAAR